MTTELDLLAFGDDQDLLAELAGLSAKSNTGVGNDGQSIPQLRINQNDMDCKHGLGAWVVGMSKNKDGNIAEHGQKVVEFIILAVRYNFSYYVQNDKTKNCGSALFSNFREEVYGTNYGFLCGKTCPYRAEGLNPKCGAQIVIFGVAITESGERIKCIHYAKRSGYKAFSDILSDRSFFSVNTATGTQALESYMLSIFLGQERKKSGGVNYFVPVLTKGRLQIVADAEGKRDMSLVHALYKDHLEANKAIELMNQQIKRKIEERQKKQAAGGYAPSIPMAGEDALDVTPVTPPTFTATPPFDGGTTAVPSNALPVGGVGAIGSNPGSPDLAALIMGGVKK